MRSGRDAAARSSLLFLALAIAVAAPLPAKAIGPGREAPVEQRARWLEGQLMAPCCRANPIADHYSGAADAMRREIRELLRDGRDEAAILDLYVERHGEQILAMPRAAGFGRLAYLTPLLVLLAGALAVVVALARWRGRRAEPAAADDPAVTPADAERLERELRRHG